MERAYLETVAWTAGGPEIGWAVEQTGRKRSPKPPGAATIAIRLLLLVLAFVATIYSSADVHGTVARPTSTDVQTDSPAPRPSLADPIQADLVTSDLL